MTFGYHNAVLEDSANAPITWVGKGLSLESKVTVKFIFNPAGYTGDLLTLCKALFAYSDSAKVFFAS